MKRTTIALSDDVFEALQRAARRGHTSVSEVVRTMLAAQLGMAAGGERALPFANLGRSGQTNVARDMETLPEEGWTPDRDR